MYEIGALQVDPSGDTRIVLRRTFDVPRDLVFAAFISPQILASWVAPRGWLLEMCESDSRAGGAYWFRACGPGGMRLRWHGAYVAIFPGERIVQTESYDGWATGESLVTTSLVEREGSCKLTRTIRYASSKARDAMLNGLILHGIADAYDTLAETLCDSAVPTYAAVRRTRGL